MSDHGGFEGWDVRDDEHQASETDGVDTVERYEIDGGTVFYDAKNPLAWMEATRTVRLSEVL